VGIDNPDITEHGKCKTDVISSICCIMVISISIRDNLISKIVEVFIVFEKINIVQVVIFLLGDSQSVGWDAVRNFVFVLDEFIDNQIVQPVFLEDIF